MLGLNSLGTLRVAIEAEVSDLMTGIKGAGSSLKGLDDDARKYATGIGAALTGMSAGIGLALGGMVLKSTAVGDELDKMSKRTGISVEALGGLKYAAEISGTSLETVENSARFLAKAMDSTAQGTGEAKEKFDALGVSVTDANGNLRPTIDVMKDAADKIAAMTNETDQVTTATALFGSRYGTQLLPLLKEGKSGIEALTNKASDLGLVMSTEAATAAAEFNDRLTELKSGIGMVGVNIGSTLLPVLEPLIEKLGSVAKWFNDLDPAMHKVVGTGAAVTAGLTGIAGGGLLLVGQLPKIAAGFQVVGPLMSKLPLGATAAGMAAVGSSIWATKEIMDALNDSLSSLKGQLSGTEKVNKAQKDSIDLLKVALEGAKAKGIDPATASMADLNINTDDLSKKLGVVVTPTRNVADMIGILEKNLGAGKVEAEAFKGKIEEAGTSQGGIEEAIKKTTASIGGQIAGAEKLVSKWDELGKELTKYTAITSTHYKTGLLDLRDFWRDKAKEEEAGSGASIAIANTLSDIEGELNAERKAGFLDVAAAHKGSLDRRTDWLEEFDAKNAKWNGIQGERDRKAATDRLQNEHDTSAGWVASRESAFEKIKQATHDNSQYEIISREDVLRITKELGFDFIESELEQHKTLRTIIEEHLSGQLDTKKILLIEGLQAVMEALREEAEASALLDNSMFETSQALAEREIAYLEKLADQKLTLQNQTFQEEAKNRDTAFGWILDNASNTIKANLDIQQSYQDNVNVIESTYKDALRVYEKYSQSTVDLERWRQQQIEKLQQDREKKKSATAIDSSAVAAYSSGSYPAMPANFLYSSVDSFWRPDTEQAIQNNEPPYTPSVQYSAPAQQATQGSSNPINSILNQILSALNNRQSGGNNITFEIGTLVGDEMAYQQLFDKAGAYLREHNYI